MASLAVSIGSAVCTGGEAGAGEASSGGFADSSPPQAVSNAAVAVQTRMVLEKYFLAGQSGIGRCSLAFMGFLFVIVSW